MNDDINTIRVMLLNMQKVLDKTSETLMKMYVVLTDLRERVEVLEEKNSE